MTTIQTNKINPPATPPISAIEIDPDWNEIADLNNDEIINILDLTTIAMDYGKTV